MRWVTSAIAVLALSGCGGDQSQADDDGGGGTGASGGGGAGAGGRPPSMTGGEPAVTCSAGDSSGPVSAPELVRNLGGQTSWFASPVVVDLDGDGERELVAAYYDVFVFDAAGEQIASAEGGEGRVYAPHIVADLEGDGSMDIVYGSDHEVWAYEWLGGSLVQKSGFPFDTTTAGNAPEVRGMAAADLDGDGRLEIIVSTTQTASTEEGGAQMFVLTANGELYQPSGISWQAWPRYNALTGEGNDADRNGEGHHGYGQYGLNVGVGNIDDDPELEILATYDNHHIQAFDPDGVAIDSAPWFTNRANEFSGQRLTWGQFIRWADPQVEEDHYHLQTGEWPHPSWAEWLQWTQSPPSVVDLDLDGLAEVVGVPNVEMNEPYETQAWAVMVLEGAHGDGSRSAMRKAGWESLPRGEFPIVVDGWYPPSGVPAPAIANIQGDERPEIIVPLNDGFVYAFDAGGERLWRFDHTSGQAISFASEVMVADLNQDGQPELLFSTFGDPAVLDSGHLFVLSADGSLLHDVPLPSPGENGNGNGAPAAPAVGDLDGDGTLEIFVQTFDHGMDVFTVPGSSDDCVLWGTGRGGPRRTGASEG